MNSKTIHLIYHYLLIKIILIYISRLFRQIVLEAGERKNYTQYDICKNVDIANAEKVSHYNLMLFNAFRNHFQILVF